MDLAALTNAITDIIVEVSDDDLIRFGLKKGILNGSCEEGMLLQSIARRGKQYLPAGSSANVTFNAAALQLDTALLGTVGDDNVGRDYTRSLTRAGITPLVNTSEGPSGICYVLATPDGERTFFTNMGVSERYDFDLSRLPKARIFHTSGYELMSNPGRTQETIDYAKQKGAEISFDLANPAVVIAGKDLERVLQQTSILFATLDEAESLTGIAGEQSLSALAQICPFVALKKGSQGSVVTDGRKKHSIPAYSKQIANTCGAGDAYAAGVLFAKIAGLSAEECGHFGSYIASRVCARKESHL